MATGPKPVPVEQRVWRHIDRRADDQCWPWTGGGTPVGYGITSTGSRTDGTLRKVYAHIVVYEAEHGPIPDGRVVRHTCDNPPCCNPAHLVAGTHQDNMQDMVDRGRSTRGSRNARAKLNEVDVLGIRTAYQEGTNQYVLAQQYGVSQATVSLIVRGKRWGGVIPPNTGIEQD